MNEFKTNDLGGLPLRSDDFRWQNAAVKESFKALMSAYGIASSATVILSGCTRTVASGVVTIASGYVSVGGEVCFVPSHSYPSPIGTQKEYWSIAVSYDVSGLKTFQDSTIHDTYEIRVGKVLVASTVPAGFTRYDLAKTIFEIINSKVDSVPLGSIFLWSGAVANIPIGYSLCDGTSGTPDLRGRFVVGVDPRTTQPPLTPQWDSNYNAIGNVGGSKKVALETEEIPSHTHGLAFDTLTGGAFPTIIIPGAVEGTSDLDPGVRGTTEGALGTSGLATAHENRPPYLVLAYIMKTLPSTPSVLDPVDPESE